MNPSLETRAQPGQKARSADDGLSTVERAMTIMKTFSTERPELTLTEISASVGLNKSTVHRFMRTLMQGGFVSLNPANKRYRVGPALVSLGQLAIEHIEIRQVARRHINALQQKVGETVHLAILDDDEVVYIDIIESTAHFLRLNSRIGKRAPAYCTGIGKALLAFGDEASVDAFIAKTVLVQHTPRTLTDPDLLRADLAESRRRGYAIDQGEFNPIVRCMAAPVFDRTGRAAAAVSVTRICVDSDTILEPAVGDLVRATADGIAHDLGRRDTAPTTLRSRTGGQTVP
jgi:IclR family KDG regulon transcriptional repressor